MRFVLLEAEIADGDFSQITQAIQNALGPRTLVQKQILRLDADFEDNTEDGLLEEINSEGDCGQPDRVATPRSKSAVKRTFATPEVVDVDWNVSPTIEKYAEEHPPKTTTDKFLVVLSWFKEAVGAGTVTTNQVYTTFRKLKWSTAIKDFSQPLRDLKGQQLITGSSKVGFSINHLGHARVEEMKG